MARLNYSFCSISETKISSSLEMLLTTFLISPLVHGALESPLDGIDENWKCLIA